MTILLALAWSSPLKTQGAAPTYYEVLGVSSEASLEEIRAAYRRLALEHHPDRNPNNPQAGERLRLINEVYATLRNADARSKYDRSRTPVLDPLAYYDRPEIVEFRKRYPKLSAPGLGGMINPASWYPDAMEFATTVEDAALNLDQFNSLNDHLHRAVAEFNQKPYLLEIVFMKLAAMPNSDLRDRTLTEIIELLSRTKPSERLLASNKDSVRLLRSTFKKYFWSKLQLMEHLPEIKLLFEHGYVEILDLLSLEEIMALTSTINTSEEETSIPRVLLAPLVQRLHFFHTGDLSTSPHIKALSQHFNRRLIRTYPSTLNEYLVAEIWRASEHPHFKNDLGWMEELASAIDLKNFNFERNAIVLIYRAEVSPAVALLMLRNEIAFLRQFAEHPWESEIQKPQGSPDLKVDPRKYIEIARQSLTIDSDQERLRFLAHSLEGLNYSKGLTCQELLR